MTRTCKAVLPAVLLIPLLGVTVALAVPGACCLPPSYQCFLMDRTQCDGLNGLWLGDGTVCSPNP